MTRPRSLSDWDALAWRAFPVLAFVALMWPAWFNGYPLMFYDAGDYLALSLVQEPIEFRTLPYALLIRVLHWQWSAWPIIWFQSALTAWMLREALAAFPIARRGLWGTAMAMLLGIGTALPWVATQVMPDLFAGLMVLALALCMSGKLPTWRRWLLAGIATLGAACHASHALVGILVVAAVMIFWWRTIDRRWVALAAGAIALGIAAVPTINLLTSGEFYYSRGGRMFLLARLVQDGVVKKYLDTVCPNADYKLCDYKDQLPATHNDFLWHERDAFIAMGGWVYGDAEADRILWGSIRRFPLTILATGLGSGLQQLVTFRTGEGLGALPNFVRDAVDLALPLEYEDLDISRQARRQLRIAPLIDFVHLPLSAAAQIALVLTLAWHWRRLAPPTRLFATTVLIGMATNALVCGALSNPTDRYQARMVWLAVVACFIVLAQMARPAKPTTEPTHP